MTDLMTALPVILVQNTCPGDQRAKDVQFQWSCNLCRESHKTQVWLCFLVLSFLSVCTCAASMPNTLEVRNCLKGLKVAIEKSDAMLYAPSADDVKEKQGSSLIQYNGSELKICTYHHIGIVRNCKTMTLRCYMLELMMVIMEEEIVTDDASCIYDFNDKQLQVEANSVGCPPCEAYSLNNITIFLARLDGLLQEVTSLQDPQKT